MQYRTFGRTGWKVSEIGYGLWGMGGWLDSNDDESLAALERSVELGCNFFDTALAYGQGKSEQLLSQVLRRHRDRELIVATKIPPLNGRWPAMPDYALADVYPADHIRRATETSLTNLGVDCIDLQQLHVWTDEWADDEAWQRAFEDLKHEGLVRAVGISLNRWQPANGLRALRTGLVDSVQVVYNLFDQNPEDELFPLCREMNIAVIARVPFDEGSLTGTLTRDSTWPAGDWRNLYFPPDKLAETLDRVDRVRATLPAGMTLPELALRFVLSSPDVSTVIPGMRRTRHVEDNLRVADGRGLSPAELAAMRPHRWLRDYIVL